MTPDLAHAAAMLRQAVAAYLERQAAIDERAFNEWQTDTVFPDAVNRLIQEACHD